MPRTSDAQPARTPEGDELPVLVVRDLVKTFKIQHNQSLKQTVVALGKREKLTSGFKAVDGVNFEVNEGESVALMGANGSGKSTTLKMIAGVQQPTSGWIRTRGRVAGLLEVGAGFHPNLTGRDNVYLNAAILGMSKGEIDARFDEIVDFSGVEDFLDLEVRRYSSGMRSRLAFATAVHTKVDLLLVDEVLAVGDAAFRAKCDTKIQELQASGVTMFVVSHSAGTVRKLCDRGIVLNRGKLVFDGPIDEALDVLTPPKPGAPPKRRKKAVKPEEDTFDDFVE